MLYFLIVFFRGLADGATAADILEFQKDGWTKAQLGKLNLNDRKEAAKKLSAKSNRFPHHY